MKLLEFGLINSKHLFKYYKEQEVEVSGARSINSKFSRTFFSESGKNSEVAM